MRGVELWDVEISGELRNVIVNGVDIAPLVEAELNRRMPERAKMHPDDVDGFKEAWAILLRLWDARSSEPRSLPAEALHAASMANGRSSRRSATSTSRAQPGSAG